MKYSPSMKSVSLLNRILAAPLGAGQRETWGGQMGDTGEGRFLLLQDRLSSPCSSIANKFCFFSDFNAIYIGEIRVPIGFAGAMPRLAESAPRRKIFLLRLAFFRLETEIMVTGTMKHIP